MDRTDDRTGGFSDDGVNTVIRIVVMGFGAWLTLSGVTAIGWTWMQRRRGPYGGDDWE